MISVARGEHRDSWGDACQTPERITSTQPLLFAYPHHVMALRSRTEPAEPEVSVETNEKAG
jgi:hypothetical protein